MLARDLEALTHLVHRSVEIKAAVVSEDEREGGQRAILNAGHTIAHGLEQESRYRLPHGEAVALGLIAECRIAERMGLAPTGLGGAGARACCGRWGCRPGPWHGVRDRAGARGDAARQEEPRRPGPARAAGRPGRRCTQGEGQWTVPVTEDLLASAVAGLA